MPAPSPGDLVVDPAEKWAFARSTYRYLRLAIVVVIITLAVSVIDQARKQHCLQGSVSAFYYTPVHSVFIAALGVIGVALITIRGATWLRETLLNVAGFLAPVVAFVPTGRPTGTTCAVDPAIGNIPLAFTDNNLRAFVIGGVIALALVVGPVLFRHKDPARSFIRKETVAPAIGATLVLVGLVVWRRQWPASFDAHAHSYSAIVMFALIGVFILATAIAAQTPGLKITYYACAAVMAAGLLVGVVASSWHYVVLTVEIIESVAFVVFWVVQSVELWNRGVDIVEPVRLATSSA